MSPDKWYNRTMIIAAAFITALVNASPEAPTSYNGFNNAAWGSAPEAVRQAAAASSWQADQGASLEFPKELNIAVYRSTGAIAGYPSTMKYYFWDNRFFQATVRFNFDDLASYDFNYNVFRSVNEYYNTIRNRTVGFAYDIYDLLKKKYGDKKPYFKKLDPKHCFAELDDYLHRERWNLRYHPYDYYLHIVTQSYARWDFPATRVIFSIAISAPDKRFEYTLSLASTKLSPKISSVNDSLRMKGL
jgi:hypothetical protein